MNGLQFTLENIMESSLQGYQLKAVVVSARGYPHGFSTPFYALIDSGAYHTCISKSRMDKILDKVFDENGSRLQEVGKSNTILLRSYTLDQCICYSFGYKEHTVFDWTFDITSVHFDVESQVE